MAHSKRTKLNANLERVYYVGHSMGVDVEKEGGVDDNRVSRLNLTSQVIDPIRHLQHLDTPVMVHHAVGDKSAAYRWSESLVADLYDLDKTFMFYRYESSDHLLRDEERQLAVERDVAFFDLYQ